MRMCEGGGGTGSLVCMGDGGGVVWLGVHVCEEGWGLCMRVCVFCVGWKDEKIEGIEGQRKGNSCKCDNNLLKWKDTWNYHLTHGEIYEN